MQQREWQKKGAYYWRVFYTHAHAERKCEERLRGQNIEVFLPKILVVRQWKDRKKKLETPLFRNYIFSYVDERHRIQVLQTQGIVQCVSFNGRPAQVSEEEIEQLKIMQRDPKRITVLQHALPPLGEQVEVVEGPLQGLRGEVMQHRGQTHVLVRVQAICQMVKAHVPAAWIRVVEEAYAL